MMKVISDFLHDLPGGVPFNLNLERFSEEDNENILFYGLSTTVNKDLQKKYEHYKRKVLLNLWAPCEFLADPLEGKNAFQQYEYFDEIYSICPFTLDWMKNYHNDNRWKYIFHPYDRTPIPEEKYNKTHDVCFFGGFHGEEFYNMAKTCLNFKHKILSKQLNNYVTHYNVPHHLKLSEVAECKITLIYNVLCYHDNNTNNIKTYEHYDKNQCFKHIDKKRAPQYKCRMSEAAYAKNVLMVIKNDWNICQDHWNENEHYISTTFETLKDDIETVLTDYNTSYIQNMIEKSYQKSLTHDAESLYNMIKNNEQCISKVVL